MTDIRMIMKLLAIAVLTASLSACGGGGGGGDPGGGGDGGNGGGEPPLTLSGTIAYLGDTPKGIVRLRESTSGEELVLEAGATEFTFEHEFAEGDSFELLPIDYSVSINGETRTVGWGCWAEGTVGTFVDTPIDGVAIMCGRNVLLNGLGAFYGVGDGVVTYLFQAMDAGNVVGDDATFRPITRSELDISHLRLTERRADEADSVVLDINAEAAQRPGDYFLEIRPLEDLDFDIPTVLVLDNSNSLSADERNSLKAAAGSVISEDCSDPEAPSKLLANQRMAIYTFNNTVNLLVDFTDDHVALCEAVNSISGAGVSPGRRLYDAVNTGLDRWDNRTNLAGITQGFLAVFSVGVDLANHSLADLIKRRDDEGKRIFAIGIDDGGTSQDLEGNTMCQALDQLGNANVRPEGADPEASVACQPNFDLIEAQFADLEESLDKLVNSVFFLNYASPRDTGTIDARIEVRDNAFGGLGSGLRVDYTALSNSAAPELLVLGDRNILPDGSRTLSAQVRWTTEVPEFLWAFGGGSKLCALEDAEADATCVVAVDPEALAAKGNTLELTAVRAGSATLQVDAELPVYGVLGDYDSDYPLEVQLNVTPVRAQIPNSAPRDSVINLSATADGADRFTWTVNTAATTCGLRASGTSDFPAISLIDVVTDARSAVELVTGSSETDCTVSVTARIDGVTSQAYRRTVTIGNPGSSQLAVKRLGEPGFGQTVPVGNSQVLLELEGLSDSASGQKHYQVEVPQGVQLLRVTTSGGTGDVDLYVNFDAPASTVPGTYDCRPFIPGNQEMCEFENPAAGTWHIMLNAFGDYAGVTLRVQTDPQDD